MSVALVCDGCEVRGPIAPFSQGHAQNLATDEGWGFGSKKFEKDGWTGGVRIDLCPNCMLTDPRAIKRQPRRARVRAR